MGLTAYISHRKEREKELTQKLLKGMAKAAFVVESQAKKDCPVDTGRLRSSLNSKVEIIGDDITGIVGTDVEYASSVEFGTATMSAQPYLFPALEKQKSKILELLKSA